MHISDYIPITLLSEAIDNGYVEWHTHSNLPLVQYTFTRKAYYEGKWDNVTRKCRGLIVDSKGNIVSRPFEKFFNYGEPIADADMENIVVVGKRYIADKLCGSLGILYTCDTQSVSNPTGGFVRGIATKGSFKSEHAIWATGWYHWHLSHASWPSNSTVLFEIINEDIETHAVRYPDFKGLILIGIINNETGEELTPEQLNHWGNLNNVRVAEFYDTSWDQLQIDRPNKEGYVVSCPVVGRPPVKVKIKHTTYKAVSRIMDESSNKDLIEAIAANDKEKLDKITSLGYADITTRVKDLKERMYYRFSQLMFVAKDWTYAGLTQCTTRKEFAWYVRDQYAAPICFAMIDQLDWKKTIWKLVRSEFLKKDKEENKA